MYCNNCGAIIREGAVFCPACGEKIVARARSVSEGETINNSRKSFEINTDDIKAKAGDTFSDISNAAKEVKNRTAEKIEEFDASEKVKAAKEGTRNFLDWYVYNWKRLFKTKWNGIELKHHLIWAGAHVAVLLLIVLIINLSKGTNIVSKEGIASTATEVVSQVQSTEDKLDYAAKVLFSSLYGTWTNDSGTFTLTIGKDGTVKIADSTGTFGADAFTYTEVDDDTVRLKVSTDNFFANMLSIDMDYKVNGEILTVSAMDQSYELKRKK